MKASICKTLRHVAVSAAAAAALGWGAVACANDILFTSNRDGGMFQLYTMAADGSGVQAVLAEPAEANEFELAPDRSKAVFASIRNGRPDLFIVDLGSRQVSQLTDDQALETTPVWSPDGKSLVFLSYRSGSGALYIVNSDGSGLRRLTDGSADETQPVFSPDGSKVVYSVKFGRRDAHLRTVEVATGTVTTIGLNPAKGFETSPQWSPDGKRMAFVLMTGDTTNVYTMNADGSNRRAITGSEGAERNIAPHWSPDGQKLLFLAKRRPSVRQAIHVADSDGSGQREVIGGPDEHLIARWAPRGDGLLFVRFHRGGGQIYSAHADGSGIRKISDGKAYDANFAVFGSLRAPQTASAR